MFFDTHCHLNDPAYNEEKINKIINDAFENNVVGMINISAVLGEARDVVKVSKLNKNIYAAIGIHPSELTEANNSHYQEMEELLKNDKDNKIVAIGECGLDYYYQQNPSREVQIKHFKQHIELAEKYNKTLIVHSRDAFNDTVEILQNHPKLKVVIHCFTYTKKEMEIFVKLGFYISFSGIVTFKNAKGIQEAAKYTPIEKLLCETDAPLLTPEPNRGKRNYPQYVSLVYKKIEELREEKISKQVLENVKEVFNI